MSSKKSAPAIEISWGHRTGDTDNLTRKEEKQNETSYADPASKKYSHEELKASKGRLAMLGISLFSNAIVYGIRWYAAYMYIYIYICKIYHIAYAWYI